MAFMILSFHCACDPTQGLGCGGNESRGANPPMDATGREVRHASNEAPWACEEREIAQCATNRASRKLRMEGPTRSASSSEGEIEQGQLCLPCLPLTWPFLYLKARLPC
jgi:hypothetical protein